MYFRQFNVSDLAQLSYFIGCQQTKKAAVVDPQRDIRPYLDLAQKEGFSITHIFETHLHADFVSGHMDLAEKTGADIYISKKAHAGFPHKPVEEGEEINVGNIVFKALETPGHTPESLCFAVRDAKNSRQPEMALTGDTLFIGSVGRPDLFGPDKARELASQLYESLQAKLFTLPEEVEVHPAHGAGSFCGAGMSDQLSSTIGFEKMNNTAFVGKKESEFVENLLRNLPQTPTYFHRSAEVNRSGPGLLRDKIPGEPLSPEQCESLIRSGASALDTRSPDQFGEGHLPQSIHIWKNGQFTPWLGWVTDPESQFVLVLDRPNDYSDVAWKFLRIGYDQLAGYLEGGVEAWREAGKPIEILPQLSVEELRRKLQAAEEKPLVLDVRTPAEWNSGHIEGAKHIPANRIWEEYQRNESRPVAVVCGGGFRSSIASSLLAKKGMKNIANVVGGMGAWKKASYPTVK